MNITNIVNFYRLMQENRQVFSHIKQNILHFLENQGISKYEFYKTTGITRGVLDQKTGMSEGNIAKFLAYYTNVSPDWLFFGKGEIFIKDTELAEEPIEKYKLDSEISLEEKIQILEDRIAELKDTIKIQKELIEQLKLNK